MITTTHARPGLHPTFRVMTFNKKVTCPQCARTIGVARGSREVQRLLRTHACSSLRDGSIPSTAVPFS